MQSFAKDAVEGLLRDNAAQWRLVLAGASVADRPRPGKWSPLEYACHVRDVCRLYAERLDLMLNDIGPHYPNWDQNVTALEMGYSLSDPMTVTDELVDAAHHLADKFETVAGGQWSRTGFRSDGAAFTIETFARYFIHDPIHHLWDVRSETS